LIISKNDKGSSSVSERTVGVGVGVSEIVDVGVWVTVGEELEFVLLST